MTVTTADLQAALAQTGPDGPAARFLQKREARRRAMIDSVKKNDHVLTNGGLFGIVTNVKEDELVIRVDDAQNVKVRITKNAVAAVLNKDEDGAG